MHVILVADRKKDRDTSEKMMAFRAKWVAKYFHAESYIEAYEGRVVLPPEVFHDRDIPGITDAPDRLLPPKQPPPKAGRQRVRRLQRQPNRSRSRFQPEEYVSETRAARGETEAASPFVQVSGKRFKKKSPAGRKRKRNPRKTRAQVELFPQDTEEVDTEAQTNKEEVQFCPLCDEEKRVPDSAFQPGDLVMCGKQDPMLMGGRPAVTRAIAQVKSVWRAPRGKYAYLCHILFPDGHCQTTHSKYIKATI